MNANHEHKLLSPEEIDFIRQMANRYAPPPMTPTQRAAFDRTLEERLSRRARVAFLRPVATIVTACVAALVWFTMAHQGTLLPSGQSPSGNTVVAKETTKGGEEEATLLLYAYYDVDLYEDESEEGEEFLPDEYEALATAFDFPDA